jgi:hypothetical protein
MLSRPPRARGTVTIGMIGDNKRRRTRPSSLTCSGNSSNSFFTESRGIGRA